MCDGSEYLFKYEASYVYEVPSWKENVNFMTEILLCYLESWTANSCQLHVEEHIDRRCQWGLVGTVEDKHRLQGLPKWEGPAIKTDAMKFQRLNLKFPLRSEFLFPDGCNLFQFLQGQNSFLISHCITWFVLLYKVRTHSDFIIAYPASPSSQETVKVVRNGYWNP